MIVFSYVNENGITKHVTDQSLIWRGYWVDDSNYWKNDWVLWNGDFYLAVEDVDISSIPPGTSSKWAFLTQVVIGHPGVSVVRVGPSGYEWTNLQLVDSQTLFIPGSLIDVNGQTIYTGNIPGTTGLGVVVAIYGTVSGVAFSSPIGPIPEPNVETC